MPRLDSFLERLQSDFHQKQYLSSDPLEFVHRYSDPWDQEAVALISALLAYGNVKQIRRSVQDAVNRMAGVAPGPAAFVRSLGDPTASPALRRAFSGFVHRFNRGEDLALLLALLGRSWREYGSLGAHFVRNLKPAPADESIDQALDLLINDWLAWAGPSAPKSFYYLLTSPRNGSACKRWCMFLRWMGRLDELDPGLWTRAGSLAKTFPEGRFLSASQLVIPMDTHTGRISRFLGLTDRKALDWRAATEVTRNLKSYDSGDPTRFDFALSRLGILDLCQSRYRAEICERCQLRPVCRFAAAAAKGSGKVKGKVKANEPRRLSARKS